MTAFSTIRSIDIDTADTLDRLIRVIRWKVDAGLDASSLVEALAERLDAIAANAPEADAVALRAIIADLSA